MATKHHGPGVSVCLQNKKGNISSSAALGKCGQPAQCTFYPLKKKRIIQEFHKICSCLSLFVARFPPPPFHPFLFLLYRLAAPPPLRDAVMIPACICSHLILKSPSVCHSFILSFFLSFFLSFIPLKFSSMVSYNSVKHVAACQNASILKLAQQNKFF